MNGNEVISVLHVDDDTQFSELTKTMLEREYDTFEVVTTNDPHDVTGLLDRHDVDCLVSDYEMPGMDGIELLEQVRETDRTLPVILFTGKGTEAVASRAISAGVTEYLQKEGSRDQFALLANRIQNAVEHRIDQRRREQYQTIVETAGDAMYVLDEDGNIEIVNEAFERMFGTDREELIGNHVSEFFASTQIEQGTEAIKSLLADDERDAEIVTWSDRRQDGESRIYETTLSVVEQDGFVGSVGIMRDITEERREEKLLSGLFEESLHGIGVKEIVTDDSGEPVDYIYKQVNDRFEELTGLDGDDVVGKRATEVIDGIEETPFIEIFGEVALEGTTASFEQYSAPLERYYKVSAFSPRPGECITIFSEITERKQREKALERYEKLVEYSPDLLVTLDEDMTVEYQSPPSPLFDWEPKVVEGENPLDEIHPDDRKALLEHFDELYADPEQIATTEFRAKDANGEWQWLESRGQNLQDDDVIDGVLAAMRRITGRKQQEKQLARYGEALEQLQRSTQTLLEATDREEIATHAIDVFERVFEFNIAGLWLSPTDQDLLEPVAISQDGQELVRELPTYSAETQSLSWEAYQQQELRYIREMDTHDNRLNPDTPIQSEVIVPLDQYGLLNIGSTEPDAFSDHEIALIELWSDTLTVVFARITQLELLREREAELKRERDRLDEFASVISHDLRNPLNVAVGRTELAALECESEHLDDVMQALSRMDDLLADLLALARQGETVGEREKLSLEDVASECWAHVETREATIRKDDHATLKADRSRFTEALENLFRNAIEHGDGEVTVSVGVLPDEPGIYIADDGPGIPDQKRDEIFDSGFSTSLEGTGFGLTIVEQICEAHGWEITVTESDAGGARFEITRIESLEC